MAMNSTKATDNAANAAAEVKEEAVMNNNAANTETVNAPATQEQQAQVPATVPEQPTEKVGFWQGPIGSKIKKGAKWVAAGAAIVGGLFVANKLGNATGYAQGRADADAAYANNGSGDPEPDDIPEDAIVPDDGDYTEV